MTEATLRWAKRLTGVSVLLLLIGIVSYYNAMPSMYEELEPAQSHMLELGPGENGQVEIEALGEYVALRLEGENDAALRLVDSDGQVESGSNPSAIDITRTGEDGVLYVPVKVFRSTTSGEYTLYNEGDTTLWFVDDLSAQAALFTKPWFVVMMVVKLEQVHLEVEQVKAVEQVKVQYLPMMNLSIVVVLFFVILCQSGLFSA